MPLLFTFNNCFATSLNGSSLLYVLGTIEFGGSHAISIPSLTFGAPQTTCTKPSSFRSTSLTTASSSIKTLDRWSEFSIFCTEMTFAIITSLYFGANDSTDSTSTNRVPIKFTKSFIGRFMFVYFFNQFTEIIILKLPQKT